MASRSLFLSRRIWPWLLVVLGITYALRSGFGTSSNVRALDSQWLYVAGVTFARGESPYHVASLESSWRTHLPTPPIDCPFAYAPTVLVPCAGLAPLPWPAARTVLDVLNVAALLAVVALAVALAQASRQLGEDEAGGEHVGPLVAAAAGCLLSGVPAVLLLGQTSFFGIAGASGAWLAAIRRRPGWMAVALLLCTFKPQVALLSLVWLLCTGHARLVLRSAWLAALFGAAALVVLPWHGLAGEFVDALRGYQEFSANRPPEVSGMAALFDGVPGVLSRPSSWLLVAVVVTVAAARWCVRTGRPQLGPAALALPLALTGALVQLHPYDVVVYLPVVALLPSLRSRGALLLWSVALVVVGRASNVLALLQRSGAPASWTPASIVSIAALPVLALAVLRMRGRDETLETKVVGV